MAKERITYLDSLKGLLIILVMVGHSHPPNFLYSAIYIFHMPAFFMLSGMFLKPLQKGKFKDILLKYAKAYLKPYYITVIILFFMVTVYTYLRSTQHSFIFYKEPEFLMLGVLGSYSYPIWFLFALFWGVIIYRFLRERLNDIPLFLVVLTIFILSTIPTLKFKMGNSIEPFALTHGLSSLLFIYIGNMLRCHWNVMAEIANSWITYVVMAILFTYSMIYGQLDMFYFSYPHGLTSVTCSSLISIFIICKSRYIDCKFLNYVGKHTLLILCIHTLFNYFVGGWYYIILILILTYLFVKLRARINIKFMGST